MSRAAAEVGSTANSYQILAKLASGGMAEIFLARGEGVAGVERYCVLKRILRERAGDVHFVQMFLDEARLAAQLQHPNIAQVHDIGKLGDSYFFTMEYVHGETVRALLHRALGLRRKLPIGCVLTIVAGAAAGLHHAHVRVGVDGRALGIVHRDVSPSNLMVSYEGSVKLVDFGVAKAADQAHETKSGTVKGKISYLSPEQCRGKRVDRRSDLFSLGICLWEMLTTERLYRRDSDFENMNAIVSEPPPPPSSRRPDVPPALDQLVLRLLAKEPADRYQTADEVVEAVEAVAARTGSVLSASVLGRFLRELFGQRPEPWLELEGLQEHGEAITVTSEPIPRELAIPPADRIDHQLSSVVDLSPRQVTESLDLLQVEAQVESRPPARKPSEPTAQIGKPAKRGFPLAAPPATNPGAAVPAAPEPAASGPADSGPAASGPAASGPAASGPAASGPAASGPAASGPMASARPSGPSPTRSLAGVDDFTGSSAIALPAPPTLPLVPASGPPGSRAAQAAIAPDGPAPPAAGAPGPRGAPASAPGSREPPGASAPGPRAAPATAAPGASATLAARGAAPAGASGAFAVQDTVAPAPSGAFAAPGAAPASQSAAFAASSGAHVTPSGAAESLPGRRDAGARGRAGAHRPGWPLYAVIAGAALAGSIAVVVVMRSGSEVAAGDAARPGGSPAAPGAAIAAAPPRRTPPIVVPIDEPVAPPSGDRVSGGSSAVASAASAPSADSAPAAPAAAASVPPAKPASSSRPGPGAAPSRPAGSRTTRGAPLGSSHPADRREVRVDNLLWLYSDGQYDKVVAQCADGPVSAEHAPLCFIAACHVGDEATARRLLAAVPAARRDQLTMNCKQLGVDLQKADCEADPMACQH